MRPSPAAFSSLTALLAGAFAALAGLNPLGAQEIRYVGSLGFSSGSYIFADQTESLSLLNSVSLSRGRLSLSATLPIIAQNSDAVAFLGGGMMPTGGADHGALADRHTDSGMDMGENSSGGMQRSYEASIGDPVFRSSFQGFGGSGSLRSLAVEGMAKAPLAPLSSGVGTGAWDLGVGVSAVLAVGKTLLFSSASYWSPGDLPELVLEEYVDFSVGAGRMFGPRWSVLSSLNVATAVIKTIDPPASLGLNLGFRPSPRRSINGGLSVGLTEASPDLSVYLGWSLGLFQSETREVPSNPLLEGR